MQILAQPRVYRRNLFAWLVLEQREKWNLKPLRSGLMMDDKSFVGLRPLGDTIHRCGVPGDTSVLEEVCRCHGAYNATSKSPAFVLERETVPVVHKTTIKRSPCSIVNQGGPDFEVLGFDPQPSAAEVDAGSPGTATIGQFWADNGGDEIAPRNIIARTSTCDNYRLAIWAPPRLQCLEESCSVVHRFAGADAGQVCVKGVTGLAYLTTTVKKSRNGQDVRYLQPGSERSQVPLHSHPSDFSHMVSDCKMSSDPDCLNSQPVKIQPDAKPQVAPYVGGLRWINMAARTGDKIETSR
ncbi:hypothetical protein BaRGS_00026196 [Batillaria attramentaria]|uniref:Uncharacterized protein n=1 Tax=Batillaria attramentaria TaxID=370345 RepID=A0ABD0K706_9CAEN